MTPRQRILTIRLAEKINKNPSYAEKIGVVIENKKNPKIGGTKMKKYPKIFPPIEVEFHNVIESNHYQDLDTNEVIKPYNQ